MTHRLNLRRPSNLVLSAAAGGLLLVILLFTTWHSYAGRRVSKITRLGSVEEAINTTTKKNLVDDIYNATLGVSVAETFQLYT